MALNIAPKVTFSQELNVTHHSDRVLEMRTDQEREAFSLRLNEICDDMGVPPKGEGRQLQLAKRFEVNQKGARKWLEAEAMPQMTTMISIAKWAGVSIEWLITGRGDKRPVLIVSEPPSQYVARAASALMTLSDPMKDAAVSHIEALARASRVNSSSPGPAEVPASTQGNNTPTDSNGKKRAA